MGSNPLTNTELQILDEDLNQMLNRVLNKEYAEASVRAEAKNDAAMPSPPKLRQPIVYNLLEEKNIQPAPKPQPQKMPQRPTAGSGKHYSGQTQQRQPNYQAARTAAPKADYSTFRTSSINRKPKRASSRGKTILIIIICLFLLRNALHSCSNAQTPSTSASRPDNYVPKAADQTENNSAADDLSDNAAVFDPIGEPSFGKKQKEYVFEDIIPNISQETLDTYAAKMPLQSLKREDGKLTAITADKAGALQAILESFINSRLSTMNKANKCYHFEEARAKEGYHTFTIVINDVSISPYEHDAIQELYIYAAVYEGICGEHPECIRIEFDNMLGKTIQVMQSTD
jgi:hypothetical protein